MREGVGGEGGRGSSTKNTIQFSLYKNRHSKANSLPPSPTPSSLTVASSHSTKVVRHRKKVIGRLWLVRSLHVLRQVQTPVHVCMETRDMTEWLYGGMSASLT